eukprot:403357696
MILSNLQPIDFNEMLDLKQQDKKLRDIESMLYKEDKYLMKDNLNSKQGMPFIFCQEKMFKLVTNMREKYQTKQFQNKINVNSQDQSSMKGLYNDIKQSEQINTNRQEGNHQNKGINRRPQTSQRGGRKQANIANRMISNQNKGDPYSNTQNNNNNDAYDSQNQSQTRASTAETQPSLTSHTIHGLESRTNFVCQNSCDTYGHQVKKYLESWQGKKAQLLYDWHKQVDQNMRFERQKCKECDRYRCAHLAQQQTRPPSGLAYSFQNAAQGNVSSRPKTAMRKQITGVNIMQNEDYLNQSFQNDSNNQTNKPKLSASNLSHKLSRPQTSQINKMTGQNKTRPVSSVTTNYGSRPRTGLQRYQQPWISPFEMLKQPQNITANINGTGQSRQIVQQNINNQGYNTQQHPHQGILMKQDLMQSIQQSSAKKQYPNINNSSMYVPLEDVQKYFTQEQLEEITQIQLNIDQNQSKPNILGSSMNQNENLKESQEFEAREATENFNNQNLQYENFSPDVSQIKLRNDVSTQNISPYPKLNHSPNGIGGNNDGDSSYMEAYSPYVQKRIEVLINQNSHSLNNNHQSTAITNLNNSFQWQQKNNQGGLRSSQQRIFNLNLQNVDQDIETLNYD